MSVASQLVNFKRQRGQLPIVTYRVLDVVLEITTLRLLRSASGKAMENNTRRVWMLARPQSLATWFPPFVDTSDGNCHLGRVSMFEFEWNNELALAEHSCCRKVS